MITRLSAFLDQLLKLLAFMPLALIVVEFAIVILLYFFAGETILLEESLRYFNAFMFLGAAGSVFLADGHVRVDILYQGLSEKKRVIIDCLGILLFIIPFSVFFFYAGKPLVFLAWSSLEGSAETSGIPLVFLLKTMLYLFPATLLLAAVIKFVQLLPNTGLMDKGKA